ncbi:MAG: hydroxyacid dehydrogenase [Candidatus Bathyarchaeia archaeon]
MQGLGMVWKILLTQPIHEVGVRLLKEEAEVEMLNLRADTPQKTIAKHAEDVDALITRLPKIGREVIDAAERLKVIGKHGVGYDNIDIEAATERSIPVVYTPYAPAEPVANHTIGLILALAKGIVFADRKLREDPVEGWKLRYKFVGDTLRGRVLGLIGLGRIGSLVARFAKAFNMRVIYNDVVRKRDLERLLDIEYSSLIDLLKSSDFVSIHTPLTESTRGLIGEEELGLMKEDAYLINTSRGGIVDEDALYEYLKNERIAGAALDVYATEPISPDNPLLKLENVIVTPHMAANTHDFFINAAKTVAEDVLRVLRGERPVYIVNPEVYHE